MAHPDDAEFTCGGTLALLHQHGWEIHIATMTPGDCGSDSWVPRRSAGSGGSRRPTRRPCWAAQYHCLECQDGFIAYDRPTITATVALIRQVRPNRGLRRMRRTIT